MLNLLFTVTDQQLAPWWNLELEGNVSHYYTCLCVCVSADYDEIILESRSSELLLRNFKIWHQQFPTDAVSSQVLHVAWNYLVICCRSLDLDAQVVAFSWRLLLQVSILQQCWCSEFAPRVCGIDARVHSPVVGFFCDDPRTCLTPCVDTRTWKGGPTGIAMAIRGRPVGVTNSLNRNWIYRNDTFRG